MSLLAFLRHAQCSCLRFSCKCYHNNYENIQIDNSDSKTFLWDLIKYEIIAALKCWYFDLIEYFMGKFYFSPSFMNAVPTPTYTIAMI